MNMNNQNDIEIDFDRIAELEQSKWNHNNHYYSFLLRKIGRRRGHSLEIGCGSGEFCKLLALKSNQVIGVDLSSRMIEKAKKNTSISNISFINRDITECNFEKGSFDCIVSIATMHHLPYKTILENAKEWLKIGGIILILDLYKSDTPVDYLYSLIASPLNILMRLIKNKRIKQTPEEAEYWREHSKHDKFMTIKEIKNIAEEVLPGAKVKRHLFWRYSLVWHIGSTAVKTIWAKPIVDIMVETTPDSDWAVVKNKLLQSGYLCMSENSRRISFNKGYTENGFVEKVYHLHLRREGDNDELYFRDYLLDHLQAAKAYEELKLNLWKKYEHNRDAYTESKTDFIRKYTQEARKLYGKRYDRNSMMERGNGIE